MESALHATPGNEMERLVVNIFRVNGALLAAGDRLTAPLGLTSARCQVLGAIATAGIPLTIAAIARNMGLTRQNVRVIVKELETSGMVQLAANPQHQRANLVVLTPRGSQAEEAVRAQQGPFLGSLFQELDKPRIADCADLLQTIAARLKNQDEGVR